MKLKKTLYIEFPYNLEHELFRASMQLVVGVRQKHSQEMLEVYAKNLEELACMHISTDQFGE